MWNPVFCYLTVPLFPLPPYLGEDLKLDCVSWPSFTCQRSYTSHTSGGEKSKTRSPRGWLQVVFITEKKGSPRSYTFSAQKPHFRGIAPKHSLVITFRIKKNSEFVWKLKFWYKIIIHSLKALRSRFHIEPESMLPGHGRLCDSFRGTKHPPWASKPFNSVLF